MRECIYCGKQLEKGEKCNCALSVAKRLEREKNESENRPKTKKEVKQEAKAQKAQAKEKAKREKQRQKAEKRSSRSGNGAFTGGINRETSKNLFINVWRLFKAFIKSPVDTLMNPGRMGIAEIMVFVIIEGVVGGLCAYSIITGAARGPFSFLGNLAGFKGMEGYNVLLGWLVSALSGAVTGFIVFFLYSGIFYIVNKWIFKQFTPYWDFVKRFAFVAIPMTVVGIVGIFLGLFSVSTLSLLLICGMVGTVLLTYEVLRAVWYTKSASKTMYVMMICIFIFMVFMRMILRMSM